MQDEVNQDYSEQNEVDGMKKGAEVGRLRTEGQTDRQIKNYFSYTILKY